MCYIYYKGKTYIEREDGWYDIDDNDLSSVVGIGDTIYVSEPSKEMVDIINNTHIDDEMELTDTMSIIRYNNTPYIRQEVSRDGKHIYIAYPLVQKYVLPDVRTVVKTPTGLTLVTEYPDILLDKNLDMRN